MFCPNCGTNNEEGATFCANCGTSLAVDAANTVQATPDMGVQADTVQVTPDMGVQADTVQVTPNFGGQPQMTPDFGGQPQMAPNFGGQPQMAPNFGGQPQGAPMFNQPQQKAPKAPINFKLNKKIIGIAAGVLAFIVAIIVFICVGKSVTKPEKVAKKYVTAVEQCDWNKAYSLINIPDSPFLTKDAFVAAHSEATGEKVSNVKVVKSFSTKGNMPGNKAYTVVYSTPTQVANSVDLILTKSSKKFLLFFNQYKVSAEGIVIKDCLLKVPAGVNVAINGIAVDGTYLDKQASSNSSAYDTYKIPMLFKGNCKVSVTSDFIKDYEEELYFYDDEDSETIHASDLEFKADTITSLQDKAKKDLQAICDAGLAQKKFADIKSTINAYDADASNLESNYKYVLEDFKTSSRQVKEIKLSDVTAKISSTSYTTSDGIPYLKVALTYKYSGKYVYTSYNGKETEYQSNNNSENYASITYKFVDGQWKMSRMDLDFYMY